MRKRPDKSSEVHQEKSHFKVQERQSSRSKRGTRVLVQMVVTIGILYLCIPVAQRLFPGFLSHPMFSYVAPFYTDLSRPADFSLNHTVNLYLSPQEGIRLGIWHTVPETLWQEAQGKDLGWYEQTLQNGAPIFIYLHGNGGTRCCTESGATHRIGVVNLLSAAGFHVFSLDYRGFGDSSGEPTEAGLTTDALYLYQWVRARSGSSLIIFWGHSLGTGVAANTAVRLQEQGTTIDGVMLEGAFSKIPPGQEGAHHPFAWFYWRFPYFEYLFLDPMSKNKVVFPSGENVRKMKSPLLILHAEDDHLVPLFMGQELFEIARNSRNSDEDVKLVPFERSLGYLHNGIYRDPRLPDIIKQFVSSLKN
ncbi:lysophosphatidylserine lipase ABHD12-like [Sardina pilchardus]|uniref:lysophosphatidylserine lipase ABHD12-like n=1 Tax=Sardina pilchardus TaxID=27697 RepID=UPI002E0DD32C